MMSVADIVVVGVVLLSGLIAFSLGLVRVVLSLLGWVGAAIATMYGFRYVRPIAREWISVGFLADAVAGVGIFLAVLIVLTMISHAIAQRVRGSGLSALDRSLGLVFGLGLGAVVVCLGYLGLVWADRPDWVREARTRPLLEWGSSALRTLTPPEWGGARKGSGKATSAQEAERALRRLVEPETETPEQRERTGYTDRERREMDRLIRGQQ
jgi:membrane protein required for colicin V production